MRIHQATILLFAGALAGQVASAAADDLQIPPRKAGQWDITMAMGHGLPEMKAQMCLDDTTDKAMMAAGLSLSKTVCPEQSAVRDGDDIVIDSKCEMGRMKTASHIVISGDFQSTYTVHITGTIEGMPKGMSNKTDITQTVTWAGAECTGGLKPGEMAMPGGIKIDATKLMKSMGGG
ncbi:MAG: DUF3617 family protein [Bauldia sp.]